MSSYYQKRSLFPPRDDIDVRDLAAALLATPQPVLLWVDPNTSRSDNVRLAVIVQGAGVQLHQVGSTDEALAFLADPANRLLQALPASKFRIMSNNVRTEAGSPNYQAGLHMAQKMRTRGYGGPIMVFCGDTGRAEASLAAEGHVLLTSDSMTAQQYATFQPIHGKLPCTSLDNMLPDFAQLEAEGVDVAVRTCAEMEPLTVSLCERRRLAAPQVASILQDLHTPVDAAAAATGIAYRKFYIPRERASLTNTTLASQIFHSLEDLVYQFINVRDASCPKVIRVIAIDNPKLRSRFVAAARQLEAHPPSAAAPPPDVARHLNVLRLTMPEISDLQNARPMLVFHATNDFSEAVICAVGFRGEFLGQTTGNDGWYGKGIYFSTFPSYCHWYQPTRVAEHRAGNICVIASWVLVGKPHFVAKKDVGCPLKPGFTTHYAMVHRTIAIGDHPAGTKPDGDELVIFEPAAVLPQYVIELGTGSSSA